MTVYLVIFLPKLPYISRIYIVLAKPKYIHVIQECDEQEGRFLPPQTHAVNAYLQPYNNQIGPHDTDLTRPHDYILVT